MDKRWLSYDEQVELLQERGLTVTDTASAAEFLSRVNVDERVSFLGELLDRVGDGV